MPKRSIFVSPTTMGYLRGFSAANNVESILKFLPPIDVTELTLLTLIQDGANCLELHTVYEKDVPNAQFLKKHISFHGAPEWVESFLLVKTYFDHIKKDNPKLKDDSVLEVFLVDLFTSIRRGRGFVFTDDFSKVENLAKSLTAKHRIVIENLLNSFQTTKEQTIVPRAEVLFEQARAFEGIVEEELFNQYVETCSELEDTNVSIKDLIKRILSFRRKIYKRYGKFLKFRDQTLQILPISKKLLDIVVGGVPSKIAEIIEVWLSKKESRIIVYEASGFLTHTMKCRLQDVYRKINSEAKSN